MDEFARIVAEDTNGSTLLLVQTEHSTSPVRKCTRRQGSQATRNPANDSPLTNEGDEDLNEWAKIRLRLLEANHLDLS